MPKLDLKQAYRELFSPPTRGFVEVLVPEMSFVKVDGTGNPNTAAAYATAVEWLYGVSYATKFAAKAALDRDYVVPPLEALWRSDDPGAFVRGEKDQWQWTVMIMTPDFVTSAMVEDAIAKMMGKRQDRPASLRFEPYAEGRSLQRMHIGAYSDEAPVLQHLHADLMPRLGVTFNGPHHEIYLNDPRKTEPAKLKTVLRQPIRAL